jgi:hypothetical protein
MRHSGFRAWKVGGVAAAALLSVGCGLLPQTGGKHVDDPPEGLFGTELRHVPPGFYEQFHYSANRGYNGTIQTIGSSIDPRTPEKAGVQGRSLLVDVTGRPAPAEPQLGTGGSGPVGEGNSTSDMGWRARRGFAAPAPVFGPYGEGQRK